jgi:hypothetical protein
MARSECKNCGNDSEGDTIYACQNSGKIYCSDRLPNNGCGSCDAEWFPGLSGLPLVPRANLKSIGKIGED